MDVVQYYTNIAPLATEDMEPGEASVKGRLSGGPPEALDACEPAAGELAVFLLQLDSNIAATGKRGGNQCAA